MFSFDILDISVRYCTGYRTTNKPHKVDLCFMAVLIRASNANDAVKSIILRSAELIPTDEVLKQSKMI